jgi:hypothetical protein
MGSLRDLLAGCFFRIDVAGVVFVCCFSCITITEFVLVCIFLHGFSPATGRGSPVVNFCTERTLPLNLHRQETFFSTAPGFPGPCGFYLLAVFL